MSYFDKPEGYNRTRICAKTGEMYIAKDSGANPLMLVGHGDAREWVPSDGRLTFPHICDKRPKIDVLESVPMMPLSGNPCEYCGFES